METLSTTDLFRGESNDNRLTCSQKANNIEFWLVLFVYPEQTVEHATEFPVIWKVKSLVRRQRSEVC